MAERAGDTKEAVAFYRAALDAPGGDQEKATISGRIQALAGGEQASPVAEEGSLLQGPSGLKGVADFDITYTPGAKPTAQFVKGRMLSVD